MSDPYHRYVYGSAFEGKKISLIPGRTNSFTILPDGVGAISFVLTSEAGMEPWPKRAFVLEGHGLKIEDQTDDQGKFSHSPAEFGDYKLQVGDASYVVPAIPPEGTPVEIGAPFSAHDDQREAFQGPTGNELTADEQEAEFDSGSQ